MPHRMVRALAMVLMAVAVAGCGASPQELVERAKQKAADGDISSSVIDLKNALEQDGNLTEARALLGQQYLRMGDALSAVKELGRAVELGSADENVRADYLRARLAAGQAAEVLEELSQFSADAMTPLLWVVRGDALIAARDLTSAAGAFQAALRIDPNLAMAFLGMAKVAWLSNDESQAREHFAKAESLAPNDAELWLTKGEFELGRGQFGAAEAAFRAAREKGAAGVSHLNASLGIARAQLAKGELDAAEAQVAETLKQFPQQPLAHYLAALVAQQKGELDSAHDHVLRVLQRAPDHIPSVYLRGVIAARQEKWAQAEEDLTRVVSAVPQDVQALKMLANVQMRQDKADRALITLENGASLGEADAQFQAMLGTLLLRSKRTSEAMTALNKAATLAPDVPEMRTQLALGYLALNESAQATEQLKAAASISNDDIQSDVLLIMVQLRDRQFADALAQSLKLSEQRPEDPMPLNMMAAAYIGQEKFSEARGVLTKALQLDPKFSAAKLNLALLALRDNKVDEAYRLYDEAWSEDRRNYRALLALAEIDLRRGQADKATKMLQDARSESKTALEPRLALANFYNQLERGRLALEVAEEAHAISADNPMVQLALARAQILTQQSAKALPLLNSMAEKLPKSPDILYEQARANADQRNIPAAKSLLTEVLALTERKHVGAHELLARLAIAERDSAAARVELAALRDLTGKDSRSTRLLAADLLASEGKFDEAAVQYRQLLNEQDATLLVQRLAQALRGAGKANEANEVFAGWLKKYPNDVIVTVSLAQAHYDGGDTTKARAVYEAFLAQRPDDPLVLNNLAWLYEDQPNKAAEMAEKALQKAPGNAEIMDSAGWFKFKLGAVDEGVRLLRNAAQLSSNPEIKYHLAAALVEQGNKQEARKLLDEIAKGDLQFTSREVAAALRGTL